ncbi:translin-like [Anneissia japonica]|uniref:translin-like n=1 Tax=Anneissia japonica TaxID=1529436 RepID=UPI0014254ED7|nr:translin-like [Anneissia japonica]
MAKNKVHQLHTRVFLLMLYWLTTTTMSSVQEIFSSFNDYLTTDHDIREEIRISVRVLEQTAREIMTLLQSIHQRDGLKQIPAICGKSREKFESVKSSYADLAGKFPIENYYKFHDHWRFVTQRLIFLSALTTYLETETLITREETAKLFGVEVQRGNGFLLDLEDYLHGLLMLSSELSRLAVNSVTAGDYERPLKISSFLGEVNTGFRLLNLKNDSLRKKFDSLKYDIKKVEEVVYDISIRGLQPVEKIPKTE